MSQHPTQNSKAARSFYAAWLALGLLQLALLSGCGKAASSDEAGDALFSSASPTDSAAQAGQTVARPVRVSRSFFDDSTSGSISLGGGNLQTVSVRWDETPSSDDHPGCAVFGTTGVQLCFTLMNDVDSFGLNAHEMQAAGLSAYLTAHVGAPCPGVEWEVTFASAARLPAAVSSRQVTQFSARFAARAPSASGCAAAPITAELTVQK